MKEKGNRICLEPCTIKQIVDSKDHETLFQLD